jgi:hypothetical protein
MYSQSKTTGGNIPFSLIPQMTLLTYSAAGYTSPMSGVTVTYRSPAAG